MVGAVSRSVQDRAARWAGRGAFLGEAEHADRKVRTLCMTLTFAGCRFSETRALTADRVDLAAGVLVFGTATTALCLFPLPSSMRSTWRTASASCSPVEAKGAPSFPGPGRA